MTGIEWVAAFNTASYRCGVGDDQVWCQANELRGQGPSADWIVPAGKTVVDPNIAALRSTRAREDLVARPRDGPAILDRPLSSSRASRCAASAALLGACRERPRAMPPPAAEQRDEVAPPHSITSSARASSVGGTSRPSAVAVLRLSTSSYLVGPWTGSSAGFSPLRMRSTYSAAFRYWPTFSPHRRSSRRRRRSYVRSRPRAVCDGPPA